jgi:hypothetical protein
MMICLTTMIKIHKFVMILAIVCLCGCGAEEGGTPVPGVLTSIVMIPTSVKLAKSSGTYKFTASGRDQFGRHVAIVPTWSTSGGVGTVTQSGVLTISSSAATGEVKATVNGTIEGISTVTVTDGTLSTITVSPASTIAYVGDSRQFTATGRDSLGNTVGLNPIWSVSPPTIGIIGTTGIFVGQLAGIGAVTATQSTVHGDAGITVYDYPSF